MKISSDSAATEAKEFAMSFREFVTLMAMMVSITALAIDAVLPILSNAGKDLSVSDSNQAQYIIGSLLLGLTLGQLIYGPLADSYGRKRSVYIGLFIFICGSLLSYMADSFTAMLIGRVLQGVGAAAPRVSSIAIVRDLFVGREMARVMSFVMAVFIFVPVIAPALGELVMSVSHWRMVFIMFALMALGIALWMYIRLPETLKPEDRHPFGFGEIWKSVKIVLGNAQTLGHTVSAGLVFSCLIAYLTSAQQIYQQYYHTGQLFVFYFALSAISVGVASLVNSAIVRNMGMRRISIISLIALIMISGLFLIVSLNYPSSTPFWAFMTFAIVAFFCLGLLFGNLNAMAMEPMGHQAGVASSVIGALTSAISTLVGSLVGQWYDMTQIPLAAGFAVLASSALVIQFILLKNR